MTAPSYASSVPPGSAVSVSVSVSNDAVRRERARRTELAVVRQRRTRQRLALMHRVRCG